MQGGKSVQSLDLVQTQVVGDLKNQCFQLVPAFLPDAVDASGLEYFSPPWYANPALHKTKKRQMIMFC